MGGIINLKKRSMVFESASTHVIVPLDPMEGTWYTDPIHTKEELHHIYKIIVQDEDQVNPVDEGMLCWENDSECFSDSNEELENWKSQLHEVSVFRSLQTIQNFHRISTIERTLPEKRMQVIISSLKLP